MRRKRRNHSPAFKVKVAMAALQGDKTLAQLASQYDVHVNQIQTWCNQLKQNIVSLFDSGIDKNKDHDAVVKLLQAKIGQLTGKVRTSMSRECLQLWVSRMALS